MRVPPGILMVHWGPPAASTLVRVFVSACPALAAHLLCDCPHAHGDLQASQSAVDVRGTIGAARHLILPGCCLIEMPARHRPRAPQPGSPDPQCGLACRAGILGRSDVCCYKRRQSEVFFVWISDPLLQTSSIRWLFRRKSRFLDAD